MRVYKSFVENDEFFFYIFIINEIWCNIVLSLFLIFDNFFMNYI